MIKSSGWSNSSTNPEEGGFKITRTWGCYQALCHNEMLVTFAIVHSIRKSLNEAKKCMNTSHIHCWD